MELWDILDGYGNKTGETIIRGEVLKKGQYHLVVHIWIVNNRGEFLIQKRAGHLKLLPGIWAATGGSAIKGEDSKAAAIREVEEELGIKVDEVKLSKLTRVKRKESFADVWLLKQDFNIEDLRLLEKEVSDAAWVRKEEIIEMIEVGRFHSYGEEYLKLVFSVI